MILIVKCNKMLSNQIWYIYFLKIKFMKDLFT